MLIHLVPPMHPYKLQHPVLLRMRSRLCSLDLAIPTMEMPAPRIQALIAFLAACPHLHRLQLAWSVQLQPSLLHALVNNEVIGLGLTELTLQSDVAYELPDALANALAVWIEQRRTLTSLTLAGLAMTDATSDVFLVTLLALPQLTVMSLQGSAALAAQFWRPLRLPSQLRSLDISDWDGRASTDVITALRTVPHLREFALRGHATVELPFELELQLGRGNDDVALLVMCLFHLHKLQRLALNESNITCDGAIKLASALPHCKALRVLGLRQNGIGHDGAVAVLSALASLSGVRYVDLAFNAIPSTSALRSMTSTPGITLDLDGNTV
ncbi:hypothetical protein SPRG_15077 [Saprolegnia parasitica CBS 223.65]|uniref:F-box domain-containing protein n=1 Tax=Saprolegnia parasitica (strain CBS 223.65) TaxID=695850 RepID=A0A067BYW8_SAPPC|nr:hypothetical protein SPRG_15077 [Saprolegnia parasitica CBS 223.65]KDO19747.1 hypothetical protein SPRG_15077 [Saprolegnia parasitica CBS 223.65]|eukprot:XP_012209558.1 hypothetical protein SPRG_15077 [Saprolegnia parasitica CBS 223.65]